MHDIRWIREEPDVFDQEMRRRGLKPMAFDVHQLDQKKRQVTSRLQELQTERNALAKSIGAAKSRGEDASQYMTRSGEVKEEIPALEEEERRLTAELETILAILPNRLDQDVPQGGDETANQLVRSVGTPKTFSFAPRAHYELGEALHMMDFEAAARMSGARFVVLKGALARLERALTQFMIDVHVDHFGYTLVAPPYLVRDEAMFGTGQLPKFAEDSFKTTDGRWLIPTSEVSLTNLVREQVLEANVLPLRYVAASPCFRSEAGSAGRDTRGMIRQHQFQKVELVSIAHPEASEQEHQRMVGAAEDILKRLDLPYRVMLLCAGDTGGTAQKTYDLEVWLPSENVYREISSCSNTGAYQARRMQTRFRDTLEGQKSALQFVHTLNGSGVAVGRALVAVLENYQQEDGSIVIPSVLRPYMGNMELITYGQN